MEIIDLDDYSGECCDTAVALGNFDGVHVGHKHLIRCMIESAKRKYLKSSVLIFKKHTKDVLGIGEAAGINIITSNEQKLKVLDNLGVDIAYTMNFNKNTMRLTGKEFIEKIIIRKTNSKLVVVGFDYKFGYKAMGDSRYLKEIGSKRNFLVNIIKPVEVNGSIVSSTTIRKLIKTGNIKKANQFLGRYYAIMGKAIRGKKNGITSECSTAEIELDHNYVIPRLGIYKTYTSLDDKRYLSITNVEYDTMSYNKVLRIESHILNFNSNIYDKTVKTEFVDFIGDDMKIDMIGELTE